MQEDNIIENTKPILKKCEECGAEYDYGNNQLQKIKGRKILIVCNECYHNGK